MKRLYYGGIQLISGSEIIFQHDSAIKQVADDTYLKFKTSLSEKLLNEAKEKFKKKVGQSIVRETLILSNDSAMEIELIQNGINLRYVIPNNRFRFWVTTPDIKVLGIEIGASRHADPGFEIHFDVGLEMQAVNVHSIETIRLSHLPLEGSIDFEGTNITGRLAEKVVRVVDKAIAWIKNEDGFLKCVEKFSAELVDVKNRINEFLEKNIIKNQRLLEEMGIDEINNIHCGLNNSFLTLTHPHSYAGSLKRNATQTIASQMESNISRASSPELSFTANKLNNGAKSITG